MGALPWLFQFLLCFLQYQVAASSSSALASFASSAESAHPLCRRDQRSALLQFKHMFTISSSASSVCDRFYSGIPSFPKTLSWDENATDCCNWDGVTCDGLTGHVVGLDLSCSQLHGKIHPNSSLSQLSHLQRLNLAYNNFNGSRISYAFGGFASLTHCFNDALKAVGLSSIGPELVGKSWAFAQYKPFGPKPGTIPSEICHMSKLVSIDLSLGDNSRLRLEPLHFKILLKNMTRLQELGLSGVNISSGLPDSIGYLKSLKFLDLTSTGLSGKLPDSIGYLKSLNYLSVGDCKLRGSIPKSLGNLTQIRVLGLAENSFTGEVPPTLSNLKQLTALDLSANNFQGRIPVLAQLTNLKDLALEDNNFIGGFPLWVANLKPLVSLSMYRNQLAGPIPFNLSGLQNLQYFYLSSNSLSGVLPPSLFSLPSLLYLDLSSNKLTGQIPKFQHRLPFYSIDLSDNKLCGVVDLQVLNNLEELSVFNTNLSVVAGSNVNNTLPNLKGLYMSSCNIEVFPYFLRFSENLEELDLSQNNIHGQIPNWVGFIGKASLVNLNLSHNFLTSNFLTGIKQLPWEKLDTLDLRSNLLQGPLPIPPPLVRYFFISNNSLSGEIPSLICNASSLEILDLSHNKLSGAVPQCLGNFSSVLSVLNLRSNGFTGTLPLAFVKPNQLQSLDLSGNKFEGPLPRSLAYCTSLEVLNVGNNKINDTFPYWLETFTELQVLVIRSNRFHGPINTVTSKFSFPRLRIIDLSYNGFTGNLPRRYFEYFQAMKNSTMPNIQYMSDRAGYYHDSVIVTMKGNEIELVRILTIFTTIDLSSNNFSGEIPSAIGKLNALTLNFSHNSLTGHIPESLGDLTSLESLDISSNRLTGRIPSQLTSLTFLAVLNLSWNHLYGPIPNGRQFNTFENGSYAGNLGLCGFPLSKECEDNRTKVQPPVLQHEEDDSDFDGFTWKIVVT
ncbi:receptor-like protein 6 [Rhododendron vialii]|uniref:receptor-like protein 6 n=1 Tax=Rhododendron vialii TaxID=182163 RepID=UPI00265F34DA|nr:receptor-like protein 6 [Rhododendron vialii]